MRNLVEALVLWLLVASTFVCVTSARKRGQKKISSRSDDAGEPYWCGDKVCYKGDSKEDKDWNVDSKEDRKDTNEKNKEDETKRKENENKNKGGHKNDKKDEKKKPQEKPRSEDKSKDNADCQLDFDCGPCFATLPMYYYRKDSKQCEMFVYGGCGGNNNRFDSQKACQERCGH